MHWTRVQRRYHLVSFSCSFANSSLESVLTLLASLTLAVVLGYFALGKLIVLLLYIKPNIRVPPKWLILPIGFGVFPSAPPHSFSAPLISFLCLQPDQSLTYFILGIFKLSEFIADKSLENIHHEIGLEPLLMTIVAGYPAVLSTLYVLFCDITIRYVATNQSRNRRLFLSMLQKVGPYPLYLNITLFSILFFIGHMLIDK